MNLASPIAGTFPTECIEALFGLIHHRFRSQAMIQKTHPQATSLLPGFTELIFIVVRFSALASGGQMLSIDSDLDRHLTPISGGSGPSYPFVQDLKLPVATAGLGYPETRARALNENIRVDFYLKHARHMGGILKEFAKYQQRTIP